jgi:glycosyltransferase involved in cell wall biosynthesis
VSGVRVLLMAEQLRRRASGGIGTYVLGLLQGIDELRAENGDGDGDGDELHLELIASRPPTAMRHQNPQAGLGYPLRSSPLPGPLLTRAWDHGILRSPAGFDVVHATSLSTLEPGRAALVVTVFDLLWRRLPEAYPGRGRRWHDAALRRALRRADRFIVPDDAVAHDLADAGARRDRISVIAMGSDHLPPPDVEAGAAVLARAGVHGPFLLSVGTLEPRKNLARLIDAYGQIRERLPEPWPLVLVGPSGWGEQVRPGAGVVLTGLITPAELSALYASARLLVYVPLIEGFGLPPVEAMAHGTPVVASPLPSTAGAAFEVDPYQVDSIADGLLRVATDATEQTRLRTAGRERSAELTWKAIARRHLEVWHGAASTDQGSAGG